jgi:hypothetical protein
MSWALSITNISHTNKAVKWHKTRMRWILSAICISWVELGGRKVIQWGNVLCSRSEVIKFKNLRIMLANLTRVWPSRVICWRCKRALSRRKCIFKERDYSSHAAPHSDESNPHVRQIICNSLMQIFLAAHRVYVKKLALSSCHKQLCNRKLLRSAMHATFKSPSEEWAFEFQIVSIDLADVKRKSVTC